MRSRSFRRPWLHRRRRARGIPDLEQAEVVVVRRARCLEEDRGAPERTRRAWDHRGGFYERVLGFSIGRRMSGGLAPERERTSHDALSFA